MTRGTAIALAVVIALLVTIPALGSRYLVDLSTEIMIYALFALSLNVLIGHAGLVSFGHAAYFAIGGYASAILLTTHGWPLWLAFPAAIMLSGAAALVIGFFCVRLTSIYFAMLTLAFGQLVWAIAFKWRSVTRGDDGFHGITMPSYIDTPNSFFYFSLIVGVIATAILWMICHSAFGRTMMAVRENKVRAGFVGINPRWIQLTAFVIAGTFAGVAGGLFAMYNNGIYVENAYWTQSAQVLIMVILGGMYSFFGPAVGAVVLYLLDAFIHQYTVYWPTVLGVVLLAILFFLPDGLVGLRNYLPGQAARRA